jgi:CRP-like cAMP-binding protein
MIRYLSDRLAVAEREREVMAFRSVEQRLAARLVELAERFGQPADDGTADMIGTSRETLATTVSSLRERGVLEMENQRVVIRDLERLRELSGT